MKKNPPLSSTTLIYGFEKSCGAFGKGGKKTIVVNDIMLVYFLEKKNFT
jgi:hypothetical protein